MRWIVDGNNVFGSRPDGWWNDRDAAAVRLAQAIAEWCRTHTDDVTIVFDAPLSEECAQLAGGNLTILESDRRGRDAADDTIARLAAHLDDDRPDDDRPDDDRPDDDRPDDDRPDDDRPDDDRPDDARLTVVTSDRGLRARLPDRADVVGAGRFLSIIES